MRVLVTRPLGKAERTLERLRELGHDPVLLPLSRPVHDQGAMLGALSRPHWAIAATSGEALSVLAGLPERSPELLLTRIFAVGEATGRAARELGFRHVEEGRGDGADLAGLIAASIQPHEARPVLYLAGIPRARAFERAMGSEGLALDVVEVYEMAKIIYPADELQRVLIEKRCDVVLFYSRQAVGTFFDLPVFAVTTSALDKTVFLCLSKNIAASLPEPFRAKAVSASRPDEESMLELL